MPSGLFTQEASHSPRKKSVDEAITGFSFYGSPQYFSSNSQTMKNILLSSLAAAVLAGGALKAQTFNDASGDIDPSISTGGGTLDILSTEVSNPTATDVRFNITVNGNITTTDWGNFMVGISTGGTGTTTGNPWTRPINLNSPIGGMNYWIGSWVNSGGGAQLWSYNGTSWIEQTGSAPTISLTAGATRQISLTLLFASIGAPSGDWYFDVYSSGGGASDSAVDALSNPDIAITSWAGPYTSSQNPPGTGISVVPEPSTYALLAISALGLAGYAVRRRARK